jgi:hypothetical protein
VKPDRPLICSVLCLAAGIGLILGYCHDSSSFAAAYPFSGSMLHVDFSTAGPGVLGGLALLALGLLLLAWSFIAAIVNQVGLIGESDAPPEHLLD